MFNQLYTINFFLVGSMFCWISQGYGRPYTNIEIIDHIMKVTYPHYGFNKDYKKLNLPAIKYEYESQNSSPYNFILKNNGSGNYYFTFDTLPLKRSETGELKNFGTDNEILVVKGQYQIRTRTNNTGVDIVQTIGYVADENGFQPFIIDMGIVSPVSAEKTNISSACLSSLCGGNIG